MTIERPAYQEELVRKRRSAGVRHLILIEVRKELKPCPKNNSSGTGYTILLPEAKKFLADPLFITPTCMNFAPICLQSSKLREIKRKQNFQLAEKKLWHMHLVLTKTQLQHFNFTVSPCIFQFNN